MTPPDSPEWGDAYDVGLALGRAGFAVITGGYGGTMEAVSHGAAVAGAHVVGVTMPSAFPGRSGANRYVSEVVEARSLTERIGTMTNRAAGTLALPGSIGTATELMVAWNINHIVRRNGGVRLPSVAVGEAWARIGRALGAEVGAEPKDIHWAASAAEGVEWLIEHLQTRAHNQKPL